MELGTVYKENGDICYNKLFYFHFRAICNSLAFRDTDGNEMLTELMKNKRIKIKEEFMHRLYVQELNRIVEVEKVSIIYNHGIIITNGNNFDYFYGSGSEIDEKELITLAMRHDNTKEY